MTLEGKVGIVTGAGRGIGRAVALALAHKGAKVVICSRTSEDLDRLAREIDPAGRNVLAVRADVSREEDVRKMVDAAAAKFSAVDILVNNAGIGAFGSVASLAVADFDRMWQVNMRGVFLCTRAVLPLMIARRSGDILNMASLAGRNAFVGGAGYCATKWALVGFGRSLMLEVREHDIRVITLCPGSVATGFGGDSPRESPRSSGAIPSAADIAQVVVDTLAMPRHVMVSEVDIRPTNPKKG